MHSLIVSNDHRQTKQYR